MPLSQARVQTSNTPCPAMRMAWATNVGAIAHVQATRAQRLPPVPPTPYPRAQPFAVPRGPGGAQATSPAATSKHSIAVCAAHTLPWPPLHVSTLLRPLTTVCDLLSLRNRSWGFVAFDNKRFAVKALEVSHARCAGHPRVSLSRCFIIGTVLVCRSTCIHFVYLVTRTLCRFVEPPGFFSSYP